MEDMRDSTVVPQIVKIVRLVVRFHPSLTVTNLIFGLTFLHDWIEEEVSNQWKILKVYCQSIMRTMLDPVAAKMKNLSKALQMHFNNEAAKGQLKAKLIGELALFSAAFLVLDTELSSKYDKKGVKTQSMLLFGIDLLKRSKFWSEFQILHGSFGCVRNSTSNFTFFILALLFAKFYGNSLRSLSSMLCIAIYLLCLLVVLRPRTDLGLFSFVIGVIGSITYNCYKFKFPTWIIASICFVLFSFKSWIDKYWLDLEEDPSTNTTAGSTSMFFLFSSIVAHTAQGIFIISSFKSPSFKSPMSDYKNWLAKVSISVLWGVRIYKFSPNPKDSSLPSTNNKVICGLNLIVVNVAQGVFLFALTICPMANCKDWFFAVVSYVVFCFWVQIFFPKVLSPPSTNTKGIIGMIWFLLSVAKYSIVVLAGLEPHVQYNEWLNSIICYVLRWVWLRTSFPKDLSQFTTTEFKAPQWWALMLYSTIAEAIPWIQLFTATHHQQEG